MKRDIVVIGAALGGVTAIAKIALTWPADLPATVLIALATPTQPQPMVLQILQGYAHIPMAYAIQGEALKQQQIYLSPPGKHMIVRAGGFVHLDDGNAFDATKPSINRLFAAAAAVYGPRVIGIILSGGTRDGAQGMRDIAKAGGLGIVQRPGDAVEPRMPRNTIQNDHPRHCVDAADIAPLVQRLMANTE